MDLAKLVPLIDDDFPMSLLVKITEELFQTLDHERETQEIARNENYYENTIKYYMGDLFVEHFRMSRPCFEELRIAIGNIPTYSPSRGIPLEKELLFSIWILAKPECFLAAGDRFGMARSTGHNVFRKIVGMILELLPHYIVWPVNCQSIIDAFHNRSRGFPGVVGAIDCCHIAIKQPERNPVDYYNRKEYHSIIFQGICDHRMLFLDIFAGMPGRMHDARVLRLSPLYTKLRNEEHPLLLENQHILGDSAYPLLPNLLTPYRDNGHLNNVQVHFNYRLSVLRSVIERAFALLLGKFRRLKNLDVRDPDFGTKIICAASVLHNFIILHGDGHYINEEEAQQINIIPDENDEHMNAMGQEGAAKRDAIANILFNQHPNA